MIKGLNVIYIVLLNKFNEKETKESIQLRNAICLCFINIHYMTSTFYRYELLRLQREMKGTKKINLLIS